MRFDLRLSQKAVALVGLFFFMELIFLGTLAWTTHEAEQEAARAAHLKEVTAETNTLVTMLYEVANALVIYHHSDQTEAQSKQYEKLMIALPEKLDHLRDIVQDDPHQVEAIDKIRPQIVHVVNFAGQFKSLMDRGDALGALGTMSRWANEIHGPFNQLIGNLHKLVEYQTQQELVQSPVVEKRRQQIRNVLTFGVVFNIVFGFWLTIVVTRGLTRRIELLTDNTLRFARGERLIPAEEGTDELARLDRVFRSMAQNLEDAAHKERAMVENALDVICSMDGHGVFTRVNKAASAVWDYEPSELIGSRLVQLVLADDAEKTVQALREISSQGGEGSFENRIRKKDGEILHMLWSVRAVASEKSLFCVAHDITERKRVEELKKEFVAMVSHDLRTPLTSVVSSLALLSKGTLGNLSETGQKIVDDSESELTRLIQLINDLLDIARMEAGKLEFTMAPSVVSDLMERAVNATQGLARQRQIEIVVAASEEKLNCDAERIVQVLVNLLANAIKFAPAGSKVTLATKSEAGLVEISVADEGPGLADEMRAHIFERFQQGAAKSEITGSGLGLSICKAIIEGHNGTISVESAPGKGSKFYFRIPK